MKKFMMVLSSVIFTILIACSTQSVVADHVEPGDGIYKDYGDVNIVTTIDSKWQINLQTILRTGDGQLINITESMANAAYIPHQITDHVFDTLMGEKEIITIDNIKYEKVQYVYSPTLQQRFMGLYPIFSEIPMEFEVEKGALAKLHEKIKDYSTWNIQYCAAFKGHGYDCVPILEVMVPNMTLESSDTVIQQWTILRILN